MKNKLIILFIIFGVCIGIAVTNVLIPKFSPFGNSTTFTDSTNYVKINKGWWVQDSAVIQKDLFVGSSGGFIYLDTNKLINMSVSENQFYITNDKKAGWIHFEIGNEASAFRFSKTRGGSQAILLDFDTTKFQLKEGDYSVLGGTQQYKVASDTASDFDSDDDCDINRQSGTGTTKALITEGLLTYSFSLKNTLITTSTKVLVNVFNGTNSAGIPIVSTVTPLNGSSTIVFFNGATATAFNGTLKFSFLIVNSP